LRLEPVDSIVIAVIGDGQSVEDSGCLVHGRSIAAFRNCQVTKIVTQLLESYLCDTLVPGGFYRKRTSH
jgi:hypothetical protein